MLLRFKLVIVKVSINEIVCKLKKIRDPLIIKILGKILKGYDDLIPERLNQTKIYSSKSKKGLGRHVRKGYTDGQFCRNSKILKRGYRKNIRHFSTVFGKLNLRLMVAQYCNCVAYYSKGK